MPRRLSTALLQLPAAGPEVALGPARRAAWFGIALILALVRGIGEVLRRARDKQLLASLDDRMLRDIGLDRAAVETDSAVSFWRTR